MIYYTDSCGLDVFDEPLPVWPENTNEERQNAADKYRDKYEQAMEKYLSVSTRIYICAIGKI